MPDGAASIPVIPLTWFLADLYRQSAIDRENTSCNVGGIVRRQEGDSPGKLGRLRNTTYRGRRHHLARECRIADVAGGHSCLDKAGAIRIDADAPFPSMRMCGIVVRHPRNTASTLIVMTRRHRS